MRIRQLKNNKGLIETADPDRIHFLYVANDLEYHNHLIGRCKHCPRVVDYTILQKPYTGNDKPARNTTLERIFR